MDLHATFGAIDIYLFDQILRRRIPPGARVIEAGCGGGRNIQYLLQAGYDVSAVDADPHAIYSIRRLAAALAPTLPPSQFSVEPVEEMSFPRRQEPGFLLRFRRIRPLDRGGGVW